MLYDKEIKIAIIGGGPAGLISALELKKYGYTNVTVYEAKDKAGGKVNTMFIKGKPYELGAVVVSNYFSEVKKLAKEYNCTLSRFDEICVQKEQEKKIVSVKDSVKINYSKKAIAKNLFFILSQGIRNRSIRSHNLHGNVNPELFNTMDTFVNRHPSITPIANGTKSAYVGMGYGYFEEVPALYYMKFYWRQGIQKFKEIARILKKGEAHDHYYFPEGYQTLFEKIALDLRIKYNHIVTSVKRVNCEGSFSIQVEANNKMETYDHVIIATPPSVVKKFLVMNEYENQLFKNSKHYRYFSFVFEAENMPHPGKTVFYHKRVSQASKGHIIGITNYQKTSIWIGYLQATEKASEDQIRNNIFTDVEAEGGRVTQIYTLNEWEYFPYLEGSELKKDLFHKMWRQQADERIYFTGSFFNLETVDHSIQHAKKMVKTFFK